MVTTIDLLKWSSLTAAVNEIKSPNSFLRNFVFNNVRTLPTETVELSQFIGGRKMAPFVLKNGEGIMVQGTSEKFATVETPNIRVKMPFTPTELLYNRRPGTVIFAGGGTILGALQEHIARDLAFMEDQIVNSEEWLCSQALTGVITYDTTIDDGEGAVFKITFGKSASNTVVLASDDRWTETLSDPAHGFMLAKRRLNATVGLAPKVALFSASAADAFLANTKVRSVLDNNNVAAGGITFNSQFQDSGILFLGNFAGVPCWEYSRSVTTPAGNEVLMIRDKYVEFICTQPAAENIMFYGAIPDMAALQGRKFQGRRFSKSWETPEPSALMALIHTRPLPVMQRPDSVYSLRVLS